MTDAPPGSTGAPGGRLILLLVGAVGAGKGTQAAILSQRLGLPHLASGNLFRAAIESRTPLGEEASRYMQRGELVPDDTTIRMFMTELAKPAADRGAILDGFPRTVTQARALDETLTDRGEQVSRVAYIEVPTDMLVSRVAGRWICPECGTPYHELTDPPQVAGQCDREGAALSQRDDDRPDVVRARLAQQVPPMLEVVEHYDAAGIVDRIDGTRSIDEVTGDILGRISAPAGGAA